MIPSHATGTPHNGASALREPSNTGSGDSSSLSDSLNFSAINLGGSRSAAKQRPPVGSPTSPRSPRVAPAERQALLLLPSAKVAQPLRGQTGAEGERAWGQIEPFTEASGKKPERITPELIAR